MRRGSGSSPWSALYAADRDAVLLARVRRCALPSLLGIAPWALHAVVSRPETRVLSVEWWLLGALAAVAALALGPVVPRRWGTAVGIVYVLALAGGLAAVLRLTPGGAGFAAAAFVLLCTGTTLVLPWGALPQAVACAGGLAGYAWVLGAGPGLPDLSTLAIVLAAVPTAVVGARLIDDVRASFFERSWQEAELVSLARELADSVDPERVVATVLDRGMGLLAAESGLLSLYDPGRRVYRMEAIAGSNTAHAQWIVGLEFPEDNELARRVVAEGMLELRVADAGSFRPLMDEHGVRYALYTTIRYGGELLGVLGFARKREEAFGPGDRLIARGIGDQAALALRTARLVADLVRANRLKSEFVSTMSHELRTPLNVILGFSEMARDHAVDAPAREECLTHIEEAGRELLGLIESTLEIGKIEAGREELRLESVPLSIFWAELAQGCRRMPRRPEVALDWSETVPPVIVVIDPRKLALVVRNLVGNALKFTEQGTVRTEAWLDDESLVLRVADTGIGIRPEDQEAIFEMFRQGDGSDSRRYGGTGLGLYIARRCVHQLGGTIALESAPGRGSVFTVRLPRARVTPARDAA
jgi:signal transduction histidine kinase